MGKNGLWNWKLIVLKATKAMLVRAPMTFEDDCKGWLCCFCSSRTLLYLSVEALTPACRPGVGVESASGQMSNNPSQPVAGI